MSESSKESPRSGIPRREIRDPQLLRAMAHPVRLRIFEELAMVGAATATELAARLGESAANCSWHLRQLAKYGFIEEAEGGSGRQRPWRLVPQSTDVPAAREGETEFAQASDALMEVLLAREVEAFRAWHSSRRMAPQDWQEASFSTQSWGYLTVTEMAELRRALVEVTERFIVEYSARIDPARRPAGAHPVRFVAWAFPANLPREEERAGGD